MKYYITLFLVVVTIALPACAATAKVNESPVIELEESLSQPVTHSQQREQQTSVVHEPGLHNQELHKQELTKPKPQMQELLSNTSRSEPALQNSAPPTGSVPATDAATNPHTLNDAVVNSPAKKNYATHAAQAGSYDVKGNLMLAQTLITQSSMARTVLASEDKSAIDLHEQARQYFEKARKASEVGDKDAAKDYINKAKATMFKAAQQVGNGDFSKQKAQKDYLHRYENVESLLDALKRINKENPDKSDTRKQQKQIETSMANAQVKFKKGELTDARKLIDEAFGVARQSLIMLRDGDTLVRSLNFASKEEEYAYEIDRNNTHKMLVTVLLKEKMKDPKVANQVNENMEKAARLRTKAESLAAEQNFAAAVETLENATKQILRAIRAAGIYIPG